MASLIFAAGALTYEKIKSSRAKRAERRRSHNDARFAELERDNAARIAHLQARTCFCERSDWVAGAGCPVHGDGVRHEGGRRSGEEELVVPDVSHVVPPKWEDVRVRADGAPCKRTLKQKVLRRQPACEAVVR